MYLRVLTSRTFEDEPSKICSHLSGKGIKGRFFGLRQKITLLRGKEMKGKIERAELGERKEEN